MSFVPPALVEVEIVGASILFDVPLPPIVTVEIEGFGPGPPGPAGPPGVGEGSGGVSAVVAGGVLSGGTITSAGTIGLAVGAGLSSGGGTIANSGVLTIDTASGAILIGAGLQRSSQTLSVKPATTAALGGVIAGTGVTINAGGTISAAAGGSGTVTSVVAGTGLGGGTITAAGTLTNAGVLSIDTATGAIVLGTGLVRSGQTIAASNTIVLGLANNLADTLPTGTYDLGPVPQGGTVLNGYAHVVSGTITYGAAIGAPGTYTDVTGLTAQAVSSTTIDTTGTATAANVVSAGQHVYIKVTGTAAVGGVAFLRVKVP